VIGHLDADPARVHLGFAPEGGLDLANFLSRTVLAGFLTGVGIQVAAAQLPDMLGITASGTHTLSRLGHTLAVLPRPIPPPWPYRPRSSWSCWPPVRSRGGSQDR
jgi:Sulfate permease family